jgi:hypothetical protein
MSSMPDVDLDKPLDEKSTGELVKDFTAQLSHLTRTEVQLAMREARDKAKHAGLGAATAGVGGVLAFYGGAAIVAGLVLLLALAMPAWVAAMIVGAAAFAAAGIAALIARAQLRRAAPLPSESVDSVEADVAAVKEAAKR